MKKRGKLGISVSLNFDHLGRPGGPGRLLKKFVFSMLVVRPCYSILGMIERIGGDWNATGKTGEPTHFLDSDLSVVIWCLSIFSYGRFRVKLFVTSEGLAI